MVGMLVCGAAIARPLYPYFQKSFLEREFGGEEVSQIWYSIAMVNALKTAVEKVKGLPVSQQKYAARVLEHIADSTSPFQVPREHRATVLKGLKQAKQKRYASAAAIKKALRSRWT